MSYKIKVGNVCIGGGSPISVQSMLNVNTSDYDAVEKQLADLTAAGCNIARIAVENDSDLKVCAKILKTATIPLVADIQFDYRLAVASCDIGFHKVRINPGYVGGDDKLAEVAAAIKRNGTAVRVGVNGGSLEKRLLEKYGNTAEALAESTLLAAERLEKFGVDKIVLSAKSSSVIKTVRVNRILSERSEYPLHIGVTESGLLDEGTVKSAMGIGSLLIDGIGDTIRVSLTDDPVKEVEAGYTILKAAGLFSRGVEIISCPTCSRCHYDLRGFAREVKKRTEKLDRNIKIAVMGCVVNGPGEAREADYGIAGGDGKAAVFRKGKVVATVPFENAIDKLMGLIEADD